MADDTKTLKTTPLDALHREYGAKMVPFAGYSMPVQYKAGVLQEHLHTRSQAGLFDVSHMGQARLLGSKAAEAMETLVPGDIAGLGAGNMRYTLLTNDAGGILDDLMVTHCGDSLYIVVNAACKDADFAHIQAKLPDAKLEIIEDHALLALQGPKAAEVLARYAPAVRHMVFLTGQAVRINDVPCFITRSGYTGEDGYEISIPNKDADAFARLLLSEHEVMPIGLGARDSLRLEAGLCLYGNDIDETTTPIEAALNWTIGKRRRAEGGFPGADVILGQIKDGTARKRVGLVPEGRAPARAGTEIQDLNGAAAGTVTSGGFGPTVDGPIAMGYLRTELAVPGTRVNLMVRGKAQPAEVVKPPFVKQNYVKD
ncbi:glycine cleavage system aminomethyltransferase GcvT [Thalassospiraceae bacterium LMO-SO8]|nr:glycine cleavage system aminomethyltransferase GcvT [Alphaproteobacteria bacterium LMO-S08]WND76558.1 glycine cleavage system aminomethyltransferase GcvT [Thalassospiraceae bacterium LMO-SO8]